ncbi:hypothetical protein PF008_g23105 [Phytophthora fragariae]|uniref:Uncharacterized protein n=1 Tax=Phytophthora fragariae TaxID=53985 RepID=A0A6G0QRR6_9STRA|nr:hypothetical protein PF008_g23105 [Phytophthora fragariae]
MAASSLSRGSYLLVFPEDLNGSITSPVYAKISNARGTSVTALLDADGDEWGPTVRLPRTTALGRKVDSTDAEGEKLGTWVRQAVCAKTDGHFRYGQVTGYSESNLIISTKSVANAELLIWAYPGVAMRAYDLQFGSRGLSFLHFTPVDHLVRLKRQRENFVNMSDFSISAKFLPAADPSSWDDILAGAIGFQQYCAVMCDRVTQQLATTLYNFIGALKSRKLWPQDMLLTLVLWIDSQLEQYRNAVAADGVTGTATRSLISSRFTPDNLEQHGLLLTAQRENMEAMTLPTPCNTTRSDEQPRPPRPQRHGNNKMRKVPEAIRIPRQDGKEVCLKFLSKRGCPSSDPNVIDYASRVHFFPAALSEKLKGYIRNRFGGINSKYTST